MNKKNKILFFLFSLIPGAAHMYIGLVKRGLVIMLALVAGAGLAMMADTPAFRSCFRCCGSTASSTHGTNIICQRISWQRFGTTSCSS